MKHREFGPVTRRWLLLSLGAAACGRRAEPIHPFSENMAGGWHRAWVRETPVMDAPDPVPRTAVRRLETASYAGPGKLEARAYELNSPAVGLDLAQRWRPSADTVFFNRGSYFVVIKWESADRKALQAFIAALEKRLTPRQ